MRTYAREVAFDMVYSYLMTQTEIDTISPELFDMSKLNDDDKVYIFNIYHGVINNENAYKNIIADFSKNFKLERLNKIDLSLILIALEDIEGQNNPSSVVINEVVNLAKKFSTEKSMNYINGILGAFSRSKLKDGVINEQ